MQILVFDNKHSHIFDQNVRVDEVEIPPANQIDIHFDCIQFAFGFVCIIKDAAISNKCIINFVTIMIAFVELLTQTISILPP